MVNQEPWGKKGQAVVSKQTGLTPPMHSLFFPAQLGTTILDCARSQAIQDVGTQISQNPVQDGGA